MENSGRRLRDSRGSQHRLEFGHGGVRRNQHRPHQQRGERPNGARHRAHQHRWRDLRVALSNVFDSPARTWCREATDRSRSVASIGYGSARCRGAQRPNARRRSAIAGSGGQHLHPGAQRVPVTGHKSGDADLICVDSGRPHDGGAGTAFGTTIQRWHWLEGLALTEPKIVKSVVALGDSITDGFRSTPNANRRWPDDLAP